MDVTPIYMIIPRYSHNYALFYKLLDSNLFTHRRILMLLREATSETYGPRVSFSSYQSPLLYYCLLLLCFYFLLCISVPKIPKILFIISIRSHFRKWPWRDWQPIYRVGCKVLICLCMYEGFACSLLLDWYLGSQKLREILTLLCCIIPSSSGKTNAEYRKYFPQFLRTNVSIQ